MTSPAPTPMTKLTAFAIPLALASVALAQTSRIANNNVGLPRYPSVSPDGSSVVFAWRGDLWRVDAKGGHARRLTAHPSEENFSTWSADGTKIAFTSERNGGGNIFTMNADGSDVRAASQTDRYFIVTGWNERDGLTLNARLENDMFPALRSYALDPNGGEPTRLFDAFGATPVVSPDGTKILFSRGGFPWSRRGYRGPDARDVWMYDRTAKTYKQITKWPGNDGRAKWINDSTIVFASDREDGTVNLYSLAIGKDESKAVRLTNAKDVDVEEFDISRDGRTLVYASWDRLYRIDLVTRANGVQATPIEITADEDAAARVTYRGIERSVSESALSPDGKTIAVISFGQVYVRGVEKNASTRRVNRAFGRCSGLEWSPDGSTLFFASDEDASVGSAIYAATVTLSRSEVKKAVGQSSTTKPADAATTTPTTAPASTPQPVVQPTTAPSAAVAPGELPVDVSDRAQAATQPSPEPAVMAGDPTTVPGVVRVVTPAEPSAATQPPTTRTSQPATEPSSQPTTASTTQATVAAVEDGAGRWPDALRFDVRRVVEAPEGVWEPSVSPDGTRLAYQRGLGQLVVRDLATGEDRVLFDGWSSALEWRWSPDSSRIAYVTEDRNNNADIFVVPADGSAKPVNISRHPDNDRSPRWSADGKVLAFLSERNENESDVYSVLLDRSLESLRGVDLDQYYKDAAESAKKRERPKKLTTRSTTTPATAASTTQAVPPLDLDDAYHRLRRLTAIPGPEGDLEITPAGDKFLFTAQSPGGRSTFILDREGGEPRRIAGSVSVQSLTFEGDRAVIVDENRAATLNLGNGQLEYLDVSDQLAVDGTRLNEQKFLEAARVLGASYYDATMNGLDWPALTERYLGLIRKTLTSDEFDYVSNKFVGELNGSHLGIRSPDAPNPNAVNNGRLGIVVRRMEARELRANELAAATSVARSEVLVTKVYDEGPSSKGPFKLEPNDVIIAVEGQPLDPHVPLEAMLANRGGRETLVTVRRNGRELDLLLTPISAEAESSLAYENSRRETAAKASELSGGRIGYIHIRSMDQTSLDIFERDLFAAADGKDALLIDVRNNGGGWTTDRLLASIMYPRHAYTFPRGDKSGATDSYPQDRLFIQRYTLPMGMLCNEKSFSNAEIVAHAFKTLKRGTLVGQQTAGAVISTGGTTLLDGTSVRLPTRGWYTIDGTNMEMHGAMPDVVVPQTPEAEARDEDEQLKAAVAELMGRVDEAATKPATRRAAH